MGDQKLMDGYEVQPNQKKAITGHGPASMIGYRRSSGGTRFTPPP